MFCSEYFPDRYLEQEFNISLDEVKESEGELYLITCIVGKYNHKILGKIYAKPADMKTGLEVFFSFFGSSLFKIELVFEINDNQDEKKIIDELCEKFGEYTIVRSKANPDDAYTWKNRNANIMFWNINNKCTITITSTKIDADVDAGSPDPRFSVHSTGTELMNLKPEDLFFVYLNSKSEKYMTGEPVDLTVRFSNQTPMNICIAANFYKPGCELVIRTYDINRNSYGPEYTIKKKDYSENEQKPDEKDFSLIKSGEVFSIEIKNEDIISRVSSKKDPEKFCFTKPGLYYISAEYINDLGYPVTENLPSATEPRKSEDVLMKEGNYFTDGEALILILEIIEK